MASETYAACLQRLERKLSLLRDRDGKLSLPVGDLIKSVEGPPVLARQLLEDLAARRVIAVRGDKVLLRDADDGLKSEDRDLVVALMRIYEEGGFSSPRPDELPELLGAPPARIERLLGFLYDEGRLVRLNKNVVLCYNHVRNAQDIAVAQIQAQGLLDSADFKHHLGATRKYALAILDYLDARHITLRHGNNRKLAANYKERLL